MTAACTGLTAWPQMPPFRQPPMHEGRLPRYFTVAVFVSAAIHALLAFLLWVAAVNRTAVAPAGALIGRSLTVSLVSLPTPAAKPTAPAAPPDKRLQPSPERAGSTAPEAEAAVTSKSPEALKAETPEDKSLANETIPSIDPEDTNRVPQETGRMPESESGPVLTSRDHGLPGLKVPEGNSFATDGIASFSLEASYDIAREVGRMSIPTSEAQELRFNSRKLFLKNRFGIVVKPIPYCGAVYKQAGFWVVPLFLKNTITDSGCTWEKSAVLEKPSERETERHKDEERLDTYKRTVNELLFSVD